MWSAGAVSTFSNQLRKFRRILIQIQLLRLAERSPQSITNDFTCVVIKSAPYLLFDDRFQFVCQ